MSHSRYFDSVYSERKRNSSILSAMGIFKINFKNLKGIVTNFFNKNKPARV